MRPVHFAAARRTPIGKLRGALSTVRPDDLAALVLGAALERAGVPHDAVDEVIFGAANQAGEDNRNVARMAALLAGLPDATPGYTVNRLCASSLQAVASAAQQIRAGEADVVVARVIDSTPPATYTSPSPSRTARAAFAAALIPDAHRRFTVSPGTVSGSPARSTAIRATLRLSSPAWLAAPQ